MMSPLAQLARERLVSYRNMLSLLLVLVFLLSVCVAFLSVATYFTRVHVAKLKDRGDDLSNQLSAMDSQLGTIALVSDATEAKVQTIAANARRVRDVSACASDASMCIRPMPTPVPRQATNEQSFECDYLPYPGTDDGMERRECHDWLERKPGESLIEHRMKRGVCRCRPVMLHPSQDLPPRPHRPTPR